MRRTAELGVQTFLTRVAILASGLVSTVLIARALGPEGRGLYFLPVAVVSVVVAVAGLGIEGGQVRLWARRTQHREELVAAAAWIAAGVGGAAALLAWLAYELLPPGATTELSRGNLLIVLALVPLWVHMILVRGLLTLGGRLPAANVALLLGDLARTAGVVALLLADAMTVPSLLALLWASIALPWALMRRALPRPQRPPTLSVRTIGEEVRLGAQFAPAFLFQALNLRLDVLLIAAVLGPAEVGIYSVAVALSELVWLATDSLASSVKERQANAVAEGAAAVTAHAIRMNLLLGLGLGLAVAIAAPVVIPVLFGPDFAPATAALWALVPAAVAMAAWRPLTVFLLRVERPWLAPAIGLAALAVNVGLNLALLPALGIAGAGLASTASYGVGALLSLALLLHLPSVSRREVLPGVAELREILVTARPSTLRRQLRLFRA